MSECEFKYGDKVEVRDWDNEEWELRTFLAYQPAHDFPYFCGGIEESEYYTWQQARKPLPKIKPGQPIMVRDRGKTWEIDWFYEFRSRFIYTKTSPEYAPIWWDEFKCLPGYDYSADPPNLDE